MRRMWRSRPFLSICWACAFIFVLVYVLFELLDIDGSNLRAPVASSSAAEERIVDENAGKHIPAGFVGPWSPSPRSLPIALGWLCIALAPTSTLKRPFFLLRRPRSLITKQQAATIQPEDDPSKRTV